MKKLFILFFLLFAGFVKAQQVPQSEYFLLVGTYTSGTSEGIYVYRFNPTTVKFTYVSKVKSENPSYLAISPDKKKVYAVNENGDGKGAISAFYFDNKSGSINFMNSQPTNGDHPCYVAVDAAGKNIVATNYSSGNLSVFKTNDGGYLNPAIQTIQHEGSSVFTGRQESSHVHSANFSPDGDYLFAADLGNDRLYKYKFYPESTKEILTPASPAFYSMQAGSGPRHFEFHPNRRFCYVLNEISGKIMVYSYFEGNLTEMQTLYSDKSSRTGDKGSADIHLTPNGKFLYATNRGTTNDIAAFKVGNDGKLTEIGHFKTGLHPRNFMIDPSGKFLLVANRDSNNIMVFRINQLTGKLEDTKVKLELDKPVCLKMIRAASK